ncbi:hypothetical protein [Nocardia carnea]|uniref:hypothetical protein n=1 Tax=Nocardia carnea TaxID=37328 RepID=UPI0024557DC0|nr:hypothetical protein [Nocardia carnea]
MSPVEFAAALSDLLGRNIQAGHVNSWENKATPPGDVLMAITALAPTTSTTLGVRSHKFIAAHIGHTRVQELVSRLELEEVTGYLGKTPCWIGPIADIGDHCSLSLFPFGTAIIHLLEDLDLPDVTSLAYWRYQSYPENLEWAGQYLSEATGTEIAAAYVLSAYWVYAAPWAGASLDTGLRLICAPRVLVDREVTTAGMAASERTEHDLLGAGYHPPEMRSFGSPGVSSAWASWSGVVYYPHDPLRGIAENDLVQFEIGAQAIWAFSAFINEQIESGVDPDISPAHGGRFLRSMRSLLLTPRPQETGQHQQMREAVVTSSGLPAQLELALEALKEAGK